MSAGLLTLGRGIDGRPVVVDLGGSASHMVVQGQTRSGKSVLTYNALAQLSGQTGVEVWGIDPTHVLLAPWSAGPGRIVLGLDDIPAALDLLRAVMAETNRRIAGLLDLGIDKLADFDAAQPLLIVVLEEYPGLLEAAEGHDAAEGLKPAERTAPQIARLVRSIVAQSAKVGVRLVMLAQRAEASIISGATRSNLATRVTLRVDNADSVRLLHESAAPDAIEAARMFAPGVGLIEAPGLPLTTFRSAHVADYRTYATHVRSTLLARA